jgi:hypothetical protein
MFSQPIVEMRFIFTKFIALVSSTDRWRNPVSRRGALIVVLLLLVASAGSEAAQHSEQANPNRTSSASIADPMRGGNARDPFGTLTSDRSVHSVSLVSAVAMQQPQSYQLRCRGARTERDMQISWEKSRIKGFNKLVVGFQFGTRPAPKGLNPGQCSWIDRAMRQGEPLRLEENIPEKTQSAADYLGKPYNYWTFYVYNTGKGYFQVTKSHFGQPMNY